MTPAYQIKEQPVTDAPLLLFDCQFSGGQAEHWSTHAVTVNGVSYAARVVKHNLYEVQTSSDQGVDAIPKISITLANADSRFSQLERNDGFKGSKITVSFVFFDLRKQTPVSDPSVLFIGIANPPDEITQSEFRLSAINRMNLQRVLLPQIRIQRRCPWEFPATQEQRQEAVSGGSQGKYSRFYRCGYSPDVSGGAGNLNGAVPFTSCGFTRADCQARGMFGGETRRFGGIEFVPSSTLVRSYGEKGSHLSPVYDNEARYNDFVPLIYGTGWYSPGIVFARNDGNLTRMEVLLGTGEVNSVIKVLVNDIEIPFGQAGSNMTGTGWFNVVTTGARSGAFNPDFSDATGNPLGDPYGSMAMMSVVVPNRINDGTRLPTIKVLMQGLKLPRYAPDGTALGEEFTNNPAWILLDILRRSGWTLDEIDLESFIAAAADCDELIQTQDLNGNPTTASRFQCNVVLKARRTAGDLVRAIRNSSRLFLTYGDGGLLQLKVEDTFARQQPSKPDWSNSEDPVNGGWPGYEFGDGSSGVSSILRRASGEPHIRLFSKNIVDTPNRFALEFQDALNEYQQDSFSMVDVDDVARTGQEITAPFTVLGIPSFDQAARILRYNLDRTLRGNTYAEFNTSVRALGLRPGDLITLTYLKEGFDRQPFRILKIAPNMNYRTALITAQIHDDAWYDDANGQLTGNSGARRQPNSGAGLPRPLIGAVVDVDGNVQFSVTENTASSSDGTLTLQAGIGFTAPSGVPPGGPDIPLLSLSAVPATGAGTLGSDQSLYYAVSAVDAQNSESSLSFVVRATIPSGPNTNSVTLSGLSFGSSTTAFNVYRGSNPDQLFLIAKGQPVASQFTDTGAAELVAAPPDSNYDHANFYWRMEQQPEYPATLYSSNTAGNDTLQMPPDAYQGMTLRITRGKGAGQEQAIVSNTNTTLTLKSNWDTVPDASSYFVVAESGWRFGANGKASPVVFEIPNRTGATVHILGRAANINNAESPYELSTVTRWDIGGAGNGPPDGSVPAQPLFGIAMSPHASGTVELSGVGFSDLSNTHTISAGTLSLYYWDELTGATTFSLASAIGAQDTSVTLNQPGTAQEGSYLQIEAEVLQVTGTANGGAQYTVTRGAHGTTAAAHSSQTPVYHLSRKVAIVPFVRNFFGSPASGSWSYPVFLPDARIASAELFVTNSQGDSPTGFIALTQTASAGLRTLSGGQISFQIEGFLAIQTSAAPEVVADAARSVRDVFAIVSQAPADAAIQLRVNQNGAAWCTLTIPSGGFISNSVNGFSLPPLIEGARLSLDVLSTGQSTPGSNLTVVIRL